MSAPEAARRLGLQLHPLHKMIDRGEMAADVVPRPGQAPARHSCQALDVDDFIQRARVKPGELRHLHPTWTWERYG